MGFEFTLFARFFSDREFIAFFLPFLEFPALRVIVFLFRPPVAQQPFLKNNVFLSVKGIYGWNARAQEHGHPCQGNIFPYGHLSYPSFRIPDLEPCELQEQPGSPPISPLALFLSVQRLLVARQGFAKTFHS